MLVSVLLNRELAEVVTFSAVGNTALAATAKNTIFEELIVNITTHIIRLMSTPPIWHSSASKELCLVQKDQIWFGNKYGLAKRGLTSSQSPFCNPTLHPSCNPNPNLLQATLTLTLTPSLQSKFLPNPKCCRFCAQNSTFSVLC
jgi:hypothetical protein